MNTWTLVDSDILHLLSEAQIRPTTGSPLGALESTVHPGRPAEEEHRTALLNALIRIAQPDIEIGMVLYTPAEEPEFSWFYAREGDASLAYHRDNGNNRHEITGPVDRYLLLESSLAVLSSELVCRRQGATLVLDRKEFEAMAAISDVIQENALVSLLHREPSREMRFGDNDILTTCNSSMQSPDVRWMVPRAALLAPISLSFSEDNVRSGLLSLIRRGWAAKENGFYNPGVDLSRACSHLSVCEGLCAMSVRRKAHQGGGRPGWNHQHFAGLRGADGSLWLFEFSNITSDAFEVELSCVSDSIVHEHLKTAVLSGGTPVEPVKVFCSQCGAPLRSNSHFCSACGHQAT